MASRKPAQKRLAASGASAALASGTTFAYQPSRSSTGNRPTGASSATHAAASNSGSRAAGANSGSQPTSSILSLFEPSRNSSAQRPVKQARRPPAAARPPPLHNIVDIIRQGNVQQLVGKLGPNNAKGVNLNKILEVGTSANAQGMLRCLQRDTLC